MAGSIRVSGKLVTVAAVLLLLGLMLIRRGNMPPEGSKALYDKNLNIFNIY